MGELDTDSHSISARWRKYFSQLLSAQGVSDERQTEKRTAEEIMPEPSTFEMKIYRIFKTTQITRYLSKPHRSD
jgi:hypothetical protein